MKETCRQTWKAETNPNRPISLLVFSYSDILFTNATVNKEEDKRQINETFFNPKEKKNIYSTWLNIYGHV